MKFGRVTSKIPAAGMHIAGTSLGFGLSYLDMKNRIANGENPIAAAGRAAAEGTLYAAMGFLPATLVLQGPAMGRALATASHTHYKNYQSLQRKLKEPFSHSFAHTDATMQSQQQGMQSLGVARGFIGSEAGLFAQRYGRR